MSVQDSSERAWANPFECTSVTVVEGFSGYVIDQVVHVDTVLFVVFEREFTENCKCFIFRLVSHYSL